MGALCPSLWQMCAPTRVTTLVHAHAHGLESDCSVVWVTVQFFCKMSPREAGSGVLRISAVSLTPAREPAVTSASPTDDATSCEAAPLPSRASFQTFRRPLAECGRARCGAAALPPRARASGSGGWNVTSAAATGEVGPRANVLRLQSSLART